MLMVAEFEEILVKGPDDEGCEHGDYSEDSDADSSDTDAG